MDDQPEGRLQRSWSMVITGTKIGSGDEGHQFSGTQKKHTYLHDHRSRDELDEYRESLERQDKTE